jgi:hypothetical protein
MLVGQIRSTAVDLLGASGVNRPGTLEALRATTRRAVESRREGTRSAPAV